MAGGINESGLKQDRCEAQHGRNHEGGHLNVNRWFVEGVVVGYLAVRVPLGRVLPDGSPPCITPGDPLPPVGCVGPCDLLMPSHVSDPSFCLQRLAALLPGACFLTIFLPLFFHFASAREPVSRVNITSKELGLSQSLRFALKAIFFFYRGVSLQISCPPSAFAPLFCECPAAN